MELKLATLEDLQDFLRLSQLFYEESPFSPEVSYSPQRTGDLLRLAVASRYTQVLPLLLQDNTRTVGMLIGCASYLPFSDDKVASELAWYIEPQFRGNRKALELVSAYEAWAVRVGCKHVSMSLLTSLTDVSSLYERLGYKKTEISFIKELT